MNPVATEFSASPKVPAPARNGHGHLSALAAFLDKDASRRIDLSQRLHRDVAGSLVACTALSEMIRQDFSQKPDLAAIGNMLASLDSTLRQAIQVVRDLTEEQFPPVLKAFGLCVAVQQLVRKVAEAFEGALVFHIKGDDPPLDPAKRINLYRVIETLICHCVSCPDASWVEVACVGSKNQVEFVIDFDGEGNLWTSPEDCSEREVLEARCALLGAKLDLSSAPTGNCQRLTLSIPITASQAAL